MINGDILKKYVTLQEGSGVVEKVSHEHLWLFKTLNFMPVEVKKTCLKTRLDFQVHFLSNSFHTSKPISLIYHLLLKIKCLKVGSGGKKSVMYLNGPINISIISQKIEVIFNVRSI